MTWDTLMLRQAPTGKRARAWCPGEQQSETEGKGGASPVPPTSLQELPGLLSTYTTKQKAGPQLG